MRFGAVPVTQAKGAILAHSVQIGAGRLRKGRVLDQADVDALQAGGMAEVTVAQLDPGDVDENTAAARLAQALVPDPARAGLRLTPATTGRVNLLAEAPGVAEVTAAAIHAVNAVDPMITVATVPEWQRMDAGGMVATVKIIAYGVPEVALQQAEAAAQGALRMRGAVVRAAALVQTTVAGQTSDKGAGALRARLDRLGVDLTACAVVPHDTQPLAQALREQTAEVLFILTASATSDWNDTAPAALRAAGGDVTHFGMPVDPGNLLFIGTLNGRAVIGLPGCARSPALNGADWVLERVICGVPLGPQQIMGLGVGGLLKDIPSRPHPRRS